MREKLIELISYARYEVEDICDERDSCDKCPAENWCKDGYIADHLIANGVVISNSETTTKWIPVTERLPRYNEEVLVYRPKMAMKIYVSSYEGYYGEDDDEWHEGWGICGDITHWMELPPAPKGE